MIRVQSFSSEAEIRALAPVWRTLTSQLATKRHFHHVEWYLALAETFERHNLPPLRCVAVFSAGEALAAVFPFRLMQMHFGPLQLKALRLASDQIDAETARDFILAPGLAETRFFQGFVKYMDQHDPSWDIIWLPGVLEGSAAVTALKNSAELPFLQTPGDLWGRIEAISCEERDRPFDRLSKSFRQNLRTSHNKLTANRVTFDVARTEEKLMTLFPDFLKVESSGWKGQLGTSAAKQPETDTFLRSLIAQFGASGRCEIHVMRVDDAPIAVLFGIVTDGIWYIFRIGYDEAFHRASPGHLIIENLVRQASERKDFAIVTPYNAPPWFRSWKPAITLRTHNAYVFRPSAKGLELARRAATILRDIHGPAG